MSVSGIALIDKPKGFTSHDAVAKLRGVLGTRKVGHAGTLDPMATGLFGNWCWIWNKVDDLPLWFE